MSKKLRLLPLLVLILLLPRLSYAADTVACKLSIGDQESYVDCFGERAGPTLGPVSVFYGVDIMHKLSGITYVTPYTSLRLDAGNVVVDLEIDAGAKVQDFSPRWRFAVTFVYSH